MSFKDATFMGIMRWTFYNQLRTLYPNVSLTYGYITKYTRIKHNLPKTHYIDLKNFVDIIVKYTNLYLIRKALGNKIKPLI